jgi:hypothetical protein
MADEQEQKLTKWDWVWWTAPLAVTVLIFAATLKMDGRRV